MISKTEFLSDVPESHFRFLFAISDLSCRAHAIRSRGTDNRAPAPETSPSGRIYISCSASRARGVVSRGSPRARVIVSRGRRPPARSQSRGSSAPHPRASPRGSCSDRPKAVAARRPAHSGFQRLRRQLARARRLRGVRVVGATRASSAFFSFALYSTPSDANHTRQMCVSPAREIAAGGCAQSERGPWAYSHAAV